MLASCFSSRRAGPHRACLYFLNARMGPTLAALLVSVRGRDALLLSIPSRMTTTVWLDCRYKGQKQDVRDALLA